MSTKLQLEFRTLQMGHQGGYPPLSGHDCCRLGLLEVTNYAILTFYSSISIYAQLLVDPFRSLGRIQVCLSSLHFYCN